MARLPQPGGDEHVWGDILNEFLTVAHNPDGTIKASAIASKADDAAVVHNAGNETVGGVKAFSSSPTVPTPTNGSDAANKSYIDNALAGTEPAITTGTTSQYWRGDKTWQALDKAAVGLNNVDNTSDLGKPISTATQAALDTKANTADVIAFAVAL